MLGANRPLLGFWGTQTENLVKSLGVVAANRTCVPEGEQGTPAEDQKMSAGAVVGIIFGSLFGLTCLSACTFLGVHLGMEEHKKRKDRVVELQPAPPT